MVQQQYKKLLKVLAMIIAAGIAGYFWLGQGKQAPEQGPPLPQEAQEQVFSYTGKIKKISDDSFVILVGKDSNALAQDTEITVQTTPETKFLAFTAPKTLPANRDKETLSKLFQSRPISFSDLQAGDEVAVSSQTNALGKTTITASTVQRIEQSK